MIEVKLVLFDAIELNMVAQLQQMIEVKRSQAFVQPQAQEPQGEQREEIGPGLNVNDEYLAPDVPPEATPDTGLATAMSQAAVPSDIEVARAITEFSQRAGIPAARELITEFGAKTAMGVPDERRAEFIRRTQAQ